MIFLTSTEGTIYAWNYMSFGVQIFFGLLKCYAKCFLCVCMYLGVFIADTLIFKEIYVCLG